MSQTPNEPQNYTVFNEFAIGLLDGNSKRIGTTTQIGRYYLPAQDAQSACDQLISTLAEDDERMDELTPEDDEYEPELACAIDDVPGQFRVYEGLLDDEPETDPLYEEGEIGRPVYWRVSKDAA